MEKNNDRRLQQDYEYPMRGKKFGANPNQQCFDRAVKKMRLLLCYQDQFRCYSKKKSFSNKHLN